MRVFFFITKSELGGAQTHVAQLTRWLVARGHAVAVMSAPGGGTPSDLSTEALAKVEALAKEGWLEQEVQRLGARFFPNPGLSNTTNPLRLYKNARTFLSAVDSFKPDLVACHSTMAGLVGRWGLRGSIPTVFTAHGWGFQPGAPFLRRLLLPTLERLAGRHAKKIICVSRNDLELARRHRIAPEEKLTLVYNGVEMPDSRSLDSAEDFARDDTDERQQSSRNDTDARRGEDSLIHIYFVGRLAAPKNPFLLIEAFSRLPDELKDNAHITIIGEGPDRPRLEALINRLHLTDRVELTGALPREQVLERLRTQADIFVLTSHWEGFPYGVLEAMAAGVPTIASRVGGIPETLEPDGGILIDNDSLESLVEALTVLITNDTKRESMGHAARQTVESTFSVEHMCEKTFAQYQQALLQ